MHRSRHVGALGPVQARLHDPPVGSRMSVEMSSRSDGSALEVTPAVRALTAEAHLYARRTPGALEGADHRLSRLGRKVDVTAFATRTQLQHAANSPSSHLSRNKRLVARGVIPATTWSAHLPIGKRSEGNPDGEPRGVLVLPCWSMHRTGERQGTPLFSTSGQRHER